MVSGLGNWATGQSTAATFRPVRHSLSVARRSLYRLQIHVPLPRRVGEDRTGGGGRSPWPSATGSPRSLGPPQVSTPGGPLFRNPSRFGDKYNGRGTWVPSVAVVDQGEHDKATTTV